MTLVLHLERAPHPQRTMRVTHPGGELVIGRGDEADWRIDDPDMFISRRHAVITGEGGSLRVTDSSSGGLFVDGAERALGAGKSVELKDGMRLRMGDFVFRVELEAARPAAPAATARPSRPASAWDDDPFFAARPAPEPERPRPRDLPDPFERVPEREAGRSDPGAAPAPFDPEDPFLLDPLPAAQEPRPDAGGSRDPFAFDPPEPGKLAASADDPFAFDAEPASAERSAPALDFDFDIAPRARQPAPDPAGAAAPQPGAPSSAPPPAPAGAEMAAFLRGLGLDPTDYSGEDAEVRMEALGRRFRLMADGLIHLLRNRAREQQDAGLPVTTIGSADVNPLKFLPSTDEAVAALVEARGRGYLEPDAAIVAAHRDLAEHNMNAWRGVQQALRRMIDRFDPAHFEKELDAAGLIGILVAGGRSARLWQLYTERYEDMARAAETRFLGEVGEDFRDAFEGGRDERTRG